MIILDTNVISEPLRPKPDERVVQWLNEQALETLFTTTITVAELRFGVEVLPVGKRRNFLQSKLNEQILPFFSRRMLAFELDAATAYAELMGKARIAGLAIGRADAYIAAIAAANHMMVATRDTSPFEAAGLRVINPWQ